jgi:hypothetical protein
MKKFYFFIVLVFCFAYYLFVSSIAASLVWWVIFELVHEESLFVTVVLHLCQILNFLASFPMFALVDWLAPDWWQFGALIVLFRAINCIFWGIIISAIIFYIAALGKKHLRSYRQTINCDKKWT